MTIRYVNTASTAGGDGTTNATSGANRAYASLSEAEAALQAVLTEDMDILCCGTAADSTTVTIDGWTVGSYRIKIAGNTGDSAGAHAGVWSTSHYRIAGGFGGAAINPIEEKTIIRDLQAQNTSAGWFTVGNGTIGADVELLGCIVRGPGSTTDGSVVVAFSDAGNLRTKVKNNIVYGGQTGIYVRQESASTGDSYIVNNTVTGCGTGIRGRGAGAYIQAWNNLSFGNTSDWVDSGGWDGTNSGYNAYGNTGTAVPGSTDIDLSTYAGTDIFVDYTGGNYHLSSSGSAYSLLDNDGVGPASNSAVTADDIDRDTRSGTTTSVGADVVVGGTDAAASGTADSLATATGSSTASSAASGIADALGTATGASIATSELYGTGDALATAVGDIAGTYATGDMDSSGTSLAEAVAAAIGSSVLVSDGSGEATVVGSSTASSDFSVVAGSLATADSASIGGTSVYAVADSLATAVGEAVAEGSGSASSDGVSVATATGASTYSVYASSDGSGLAIAVGENASAVSGRKAGGRMAKKLKNRRFKVERQDEIDLKIIAQALTMLGEDGHGYH